MAAASLSSQGLAASPQQSVNSSGATRSSSSWSYPHSSLLLEEDEGEGHRQDYHGHRPVSGLRGAMSHESGFTNPSSFGSMFAMLNSQSNPEGEGSAAQASHNARNVSSAYEQGSRLARRAWIEMDAEIGAMQANKVHLAYNTSAVTSSTHSPVSLDSCPTYVCARCGTTLALQDELISKAFSGRDGKAFLFFTVLNVKVGPKEDRQLLTGLHTVADLSCMTCQRSVGWCYLRAFEASQRYKEGKFILERAAVHKTNNWKLDP